MAVWIGIGAAVAIAIVVAAILFGPGGEPETTEPGAEATGAQAPEAPPAAAPVAAPAAGPAAPSGDRPAEASGARPAVADPALSGVQTVRLRIGPEVSDARRDQLATALTQTGIPNVVVEQLPFRIATSRIGYYRDEDLPAAEALARVISPAVGDGNAIGVRDYGELLSDPQPGRLDLWIGG